MIEFIRDSAKTADALLTKFDERISEGAKQQGLPEKSPISCHCTRSKALTKRIAVLIERMQNDHVVFYQLQNFIVQEAQKSSPIPLPLRVASAVEPMNEKHQLLLADFESLFENSSNLLDQWAFMACFVAGNKQQNFHQLVTKRLANPGSDANDLWFKLHNKCWGLFCWVHTHVKIYRDNFIVHHEKPWNQLVANSANTLRLSYLIFDGTYEPDIVTIETKRILDINAELAEEQRSDALSKGGSYHGILSDLMRSVESLDDGHRQELIYLAKRYGYESPPHHEIAANVLTLLCATIPLLIGE